MPRREDERETLGEGGLRYCVFCKRYLSAGEWALHPHNPEYGVSRMHRFRRRLLRDLRLPAWASSLKALLVLVIIVLIVSLVLSRVGLRP